MTARKAAVGRGWPHGLAVPFGKAIAWGTATGAPAALMALRLLQPDPQPPQFERDGASYVFPPQPLVGIGPSLFEVLEAEPGAPVMCHV